MAGLTVAIGLFHSLVVLSPAQSQSVTPLMRAAEDAQIATVRKLLKGKVAVNARDRAGSTALFLAIAGRDTPTDAEGEVMNRKDRPRERLAIVQLLMKNGARADIGANRGGVQQEYTKGETPLMRAIEVGRLDMVSAILKHRATPPFNLEARDSEGRTAMHYAGEEQSGATVQMLVAAGAKVDARSSVKVTPLMSAAYADSLAAVRELLKAGANPNAQSVDGQTALHGASSPTLAKLLLSNGARIMMNKAGYSAYTLALWRQDEDLVKHIKSFNPPTGFFDAILLSDLDGVKQWLARGSSPNAKFMNETPILHIAAQMSSAEVVKALIDAGAKVDAKDRFLERTAIIVALKEEYGEQNTPQDEARRVAVVTTLIDAGGAFLIKDGRTGDTPLILAARRNSAPLVKLLLSRGAVASKDDLERLSLLAPKTSPEIVEMLKRGRP
jgi:ankyrin repeat protein